MTLAKGVLFSEPYYTPLSPHADKPLPNATLVFWLSRTTGQSNTPATVYQDGMLTMPYGSNVVTASSTGKFPAIYLSPSTPVRVQLFNQNGELQQDVDPYVANGRFMSAAVVTGTDQRASTTTLAPDSFLTVAIPHAGTYRYELYAEFVLNSTGSNPGLNFSMNLEGGGNSTNQFNILAGSGGLLQDIPPGLMPATLSGSPIYASDYFADPNSGATYSSSASSISGVSNYPITNSTTTHTPVRITGVVTCTMPCTLAFCWSQHTSTATELILVQGSYLQVQSISPTVSFIPPSASSSAALNATVSPTSITTGSDTSGVTTVPVSVRATGGAGGYTYVWSFQAGASSVLSITTPNAAVTSFQANFMTAGNTYTGTAQCIVTDAKGNTAEVTVPISIQCVAAMSASASPSSQTASGNSGSVSTNTSTVTVTGGLAPYTYAWTWIVGGASIGISSPTAASTTFATSGAALGNSYTGTAQCLVTDSLNNTTTCDVAVEITCYDYNGTITLGSVTVPGQSTPYQAGYSYGVYGSISSLNDNNGVGVINLYVQQIGAATPSLNLTINAALPQNYFDSLSFPGEGLSYLSSAAIWSQSGATTTWTWNGSVPWAVTSTGTLTWTLP